MRVGVCLQAKTVIIFDWAEKNGNKFHQHHIVAGFKRALIRNLLCKFGILLLL